MLEQALHLPHANTTLSARLFIDPTHNYDQETHDDEVASSMRVPAILLHQEIFILISSYVCTALTWNCFIRNCWTKRHGDGVCSTNSIDHVEDPWSFLVLADWHGAESFALKPVTDDNYNTHTNPKYEIIKPILQHIKNTYGGELIVMPGDTLNGHWYTEKFANRFYDKFPKYSDLNGQGVILQAARNAHSTTKRLFHESGYDTLLYTIGDHEIGED